MNHLVASCRDTLNCMVEASRLQNDCTWMLRTCKILATWLVLALVLLRLILTALLRTFGGKTKFWIPKSVTFLDPDTSNICNTFLFPQTKFQISQLAIYWYMDEKQSRSGSSVEYFCLISSYVLSGIGYLNQWTILPNDLHHVVVANVAKWELSKPFHPEKGDILS